MGNTELAAGLVPMTINPCPRYIGRHVGMGNMPAVVHVAADVHLGEHVDLSDTGASQ